MDVGTARRMTPLDALRAAPADGPARQLVVLCHGVGADGHDLIDLSTAWRDAVPHAAFLAPHAPEPYDGAPHGRQWFSLADRTPAVLFAGAQRSAPLLDATIDAELECLGLPRDAVAIMGFSQGAMMTLHCGLRRHPVPRGLLAYSGALLYTPALAQECVGHPPTLLVHGQADQVVPFERALQTESALVQLGIPHQVQWCPGIEHTIDDAGLSAGALFLQRLFTST